MKKIFLPFLAFLIITGAAISLLIAWWTYQFGGQTVLFLLRAPWSTKVEYTRNSLGMSSNQAPQLQRATRPQSSDPGGSPLPTVSPAPASWSLEMSHEYQKLNNCGPASLAMAADTVGVKFTQFDAASVVKGGDLDRNVNPEEMVGFLNSKNIGAVYRVNGTPEIVEQLISQNIPVIVHQWMVRRGDGELIGHYRVVKGYDSNKKVFVTNDSFNGPNFTIPYAQFDEWWQPFNRGYIPVYPSAKTPIVQSILGLDWDVHANYGQALEQATLEIETTQNEYAYYNAGFNARALNDNEQALFYFDEALTRTFPHHYLWYRYSHLESYIESGWFDRVLVLTDDLLKEAGEVEEARYYRAKAFAGLGQFDKALSEVERAIKDNPRYKPALELQKDLQSI